MELRRATILDAELLYQWRVQGEQEAGWYEGPATMPTAHLTWLRKRLNNPAVDLWIAEDRVPDYDPSGNIAENSVRKLVQVGTARVDSNGELSFYVDPEWRKRGYGTRIVQEACRLSAHHRIKACADRANVLGIATMLAAGFQMRNDVAFLLWREP